MSITPINESRPSFGPLARLGETRAGRTDRSTHSRPIQRARDQVEFTPEPIRVDLVEHVRAQIESGAYETDQRLERAAESMIRALFDA